jgi:hypothetical protein
VLQEEQVVELEETLNTQLLQSDELQHEMPTTTSSGDLGFLLPQRSQLGTQDLAHWESFHFLPEMAQSCNTEFSVLGLRIHK